MHAHARHLLDSCFHQSHTQILLWIIVPHRDQHYQLKPYLAYESMVYHFVLQLQLILHAWINAITASLINFSNYPYQKKVKKINFPKTTGNWWKSPTVIPETPANTFSIIINISCNLQLISTHKSLDIIDSSSKIKNFTYDNLFLKALGLSFKPSNLIPSLLPRWYHWQFINN